MSVVFGSIANHICLNIVVGFFISSPVLLAYGAGRQFKLHVADLTLELLK